MVYTIQYAIFMPLSHIFEHKILKLTKLYLEVVRVSFGLQADAGITL
jgi:hypothetical protein